MLNIYRFDVLFFGEREEIPQSELRDEYKGQQWQSRRFRYRDPQISGSEDAKKALEAKLLDASKNICIGFVNRGTISGNGMPSDHPNGYVSSWNNNIWLSIEMIAPTLKLNLTTGEKALGQ